MPRPRSLRRCRRRLPPQSSELSERLQQAEYRWEQAQQTVYRQQQLCAALVFMTGKLGEVNEAPRKERDRLIEYQRAVRNREEEGFPQLRDI